MRKASEDWEAVTVFVCCRQCAKEALKDLCRWLHHGGEVAVSVSLFYQSKQVSR